MVPSNSKRIMDHARLQTHKSFKFQRQSQNWTLPWITKNLNRSSFLVLVLLPSPAFCGCYFANKLAQTQIHHQFITIQNKKLLPYKLLCGSNKFKSKRIYIHILCKIYTLAEKIWWKLREDTSFNYVSQSLCLFGDW